MRNINGIFLMTCLFVAGLNSSQIDAMDLGTNFWFTAEKGEKPFREKIDFSRETNPWDPVFLAEIAHYSVLRPMDWSATNWSTHVHWEDRTLPTDPKNQNGGDYQGPGMAWEWLIDLSNRMNSDLWICLPHASEEDYWTGLAELIKKQLKPQLKVYVEYSNEVWNGWAFTTTSWNNRKGQATWAAEFGKNFGANDYDRRKYTAAQRSAGIWSAFEKVFGADTARVINVLGGWHRDIEYNESQVRWLADKNNNPWKTKAEAFATAPYIDVMATIDGASSDAPTKFLKVLDEVEEAAGWHAQSAKKLGVKLLAYEGGQHITRNAHIFNRQAYVYDLYMNMLKRWPKYYEVYCHYAHVMPASELYAFGSKEFVGQPESQAHKWRALRDFALANGSVGIKLGQPMLRYDVKQAFRGKKWNHAMGSGLLKQNIYLWNTKCAVGYSKCTSEEVSHTKNMTVTRHPNGDIIIQESDNH